MTDNQKNIIINFCSNPSNMEVANLIKSSSSKFDTSTGEIILNGETGNSIRFKVEELETGNIDFSPLFNRKEENNNMIEEMIMDEEKPVSEIKEEEEIEEILDEEPNQNIIDFNQKSEELEAKKQYTMADLNNAIEEKNVIKIDEMLSTFAINPNTNLVDIGIAINKVTSNTLNEAIKCVEENTNFSSNLSDYDLEGKLINKQAVEGMPVNPSEICDKSFKNIKEYINAASVKGINYYSQIEESAKQKYTTLFNDKINVKGLNKQIEPVIETLEEPKEEKQIVPTLKPDTNLKKAGFADVFILTVIIMVYAAIIINLISKLK